MYDEVSAGAVVYYDGGSGVEYLLLHYPAGHWDFRTAVYAPCTPSYIVIYINFVIYALVTY